MDIPLALLMAAHLLLANICSGAPIVCMWLEWRSSKGCEAAEKACRMLSRSAFHGLLAGGALGILLLVLVWTDEYRAAFKALSSKVHYGGMEYLFSLILLAVHRFVWKAPAKSTGGALLRAFVLLLAGSNLLYHFPFLFLVMSNAGNGWIDSGQTIDAAKFRELMMQGDILPRAVHFLVACFAVTGVYMFLKARKIEEEDQQKQVIRWGGQLALGPTMLQILVGLWIIMRLPRPAARALMGQDLLATACLGLSVLLAFWLMHLFAAVSLGKADSKGRSKAAIVLLAVVVLMCVVVQRIKRHGPAAKAKPAATETTTPSDTAHTDDNDGDNNDGDNNDEPNGGDATDNRDGGTEENIGAEENDAPGSNDTSQPPADPNN